VVLRGIQRRLVVWRLVASLAPFMIF